MPVDEKSAKLTGKKSKIVPANKDELSIKEKMEILHEKLIDNSHINQDKLTKTE